MELTFYEQDKNLDGLTFFLFLPVENLSPSPKV